ncbi:DoxX family protein [bacterium]|nr:DoxX family protein [bacterium]
MDKIKAFFHNPNLGSLILRLFVGLSMAFAHGLGKLPPSEQLVSGVESMGFPMPLVFAWAAALSEFLGGLLIVVGLYTRPAALFLGITMAVAALKVHGADPYQVKELAFFYLFACLTLLFQGAGHFSLDRILRKK